MTRVLSEDGLNRLGRDCLISMSQIAPLECSEDAVLRAAQLAFETLLEGMPEKKADDCGTSHPPIHAAQARKFGVSHGMNCKAPLGPAR